LYSIIEFSRRRWDFLAAFALVGLAAFLRLSSLDLAEFKLDEATAVELARHVLHGTLPTTGLVSSVGALNPPLFIYLMAIPLGIVDDPLAATAFVAVLAVAATALTFVVLRTRFGSLAALAATALFATAPWAVLYGRKIWAQDLLPIVCIALLWSLFVVLEQTRTRTALLVPVFLCLAFQLNFSAVALLVPVVAVVVYRAREVNWPALAVGVVAAVLLLGPWLGHEAGNGFRDVHQLLTEGRGSRGSNPIGSGTGRAIRQTLDIDGGWNWDYELGASHRAFHAEAGWAWSYETWASALTAALLLLGFYTCAIRAGLGARLSRSWPWLLLDLAARRRAVLLIWLVGVWLSYATSDPGRVFPHYLIVNYPISFAVAALGLADVVSAMRSRVRFASGAALALTAAVVVGYVAFFVSFLNFVDRHGGTSGDYGVAYRHTDALAAVLRQRHLAVAGDPGPELLATGTVNDPPPHARVAVVHNTLVDETPLPCTGTRRSFGPLLACLPAGKR
jgi:hypothetical protein